MEKRLINPMPEALDDVHVRRGDAISPNQAVNIPNQSNQPIGGFGEVPPEQPTAERRDEINKAVTGRMTEEMLSKEILDEKIRQDIESSKKNKDFGIQASPKDVLKTLISLGDYKEDVIIFKHKWTIKALTQGDFVLAFGDIKDDSLSGRIPALVLSQIAYSIEACDGTPIYEWFSDIIQRNSYNSAEEFKIAVRRTFRRYLEKMPNTIIAEFDEAYANIEKKRNEAIAELKKS